jgi:rhamnulokinase
MDGKPWGYLSSGTWSLLGVELDAPKITEEVLEKNFTNEGGAAGKTTFLRNINGLWLLQECRRQWQKEGLDVDHARITAFAEEAGPSAAFVLPNHASFFAPADMPGAIRSFCERTGQTVPRSPGEVARTGLESLALAYREVAEQAATLSGQPIQRLHIVGGGSRNSLLNQLTANALGVPVVTGPVEATAMGNILLQAMATGKVKSLAELRQIVHASTETREYPPLEAEIWDEKYAAYRRLAAAT